MKSKLFIILTVIFLLSIFFTQFKLINRPVRDNDEGIYLTSFLLVDRGFPAYKKTYFSQPPGFLLSVYPGFIVFGKTLQAARLTISLWSIVGLLAIIWIGFELKNKWAGLLVVVLLYLIPVYYNQALTFQSDVLITTFSLISFGALLRFGKKINVFWFIVSVFFLNLAFWTKFDVTFFPSFSLFMYLQFKERKISLIDIFNYFLIFCTVSLGFFLIFILPFGIKEIFNNSILLRFQASSSSSSSFMLFDYLKNDVILLLTTLASLFLIIFNVKNIKYPINIVFIWSIFILSILIFYRPLFPHHLVMLAVPMVLLFSFLLKKISHYLVIILIIITLINRSYLFFNTSSSLVDSQRQEVINIIKNNTSINDFVVSDEEIINGISGRLPPPELSDVSHVRIRSNNLSPENFKKIIEQYKPKLIIPLNGRLQSIKNFNDVTKDYENINNILWYK